MPYESRAQQRWAHSPTGIKALGGKAKVHEWDEATKAKKGGFKGLPERKAAERKKSQKQHMKDVLG